MLRPGIVIACVIACATSVLAADLPRYGGMYPTSGGSALAMLDSDIEVSVRGPIVEVVVTQKFQNRTDQATEATYVFPLPPDAAVTAMSIRTGQRTIHAAIATRADAQRRYEDAIRAGVSAAMLEQERADVFTQTVAAIPPKGTVEVTLRYDTVARYGQGTWELALPLVVAPRFVPGAATSRPTTGTGRAPDTDRAPDASRITPAGAPGAGGRTDVKLAFLDPVTDITSPTHELKAAGATATLVDPKSDHDMIVRWKLPRTSAGWVEAGPDGGYAAVLVVGGTPAPRKGAARCVLALDRSAAARGDADAVARPLVRQLLAAFAAADRVSVIGSDTLAPSAPADVARGVEERWDRPAGAFDLTRVLQTAKPDGAPIVLVTGGLVADDAAALAAAKRLGVPIHILGVGPAPARALLGQIAASTGGTVRFAVPGDDLGALSKLTVADVVAPAPPLAVTWGTLAATDVVPAMLPRLGAGQAMLVLARVNRAAPANARARGDVFAIETVPTARRLDGATTALGPLGRRWARNRLDELLAGATRGAPAAITAHALRFGLVSPYTAMIAIGTEVVVQGGVTKSVPIPVSVPAGMKWQAVKEQQVPDDERRPVVLNSRPPPAPKASTSTADAARPEEAEDDLDAETAPPMAPQADYALGSTLERTVGIAAYRAGSPWRFTPSLGLGLVVNEPTALLAFGGRAEYGGRTLVGIDASLWLLPGAGDVHGRALLTIARRGLARWFELGVGAGLHVDDAAGVATSLTLRGRVPAVPRAAAYLRYDNALRLGDENRRTLHGASAGAEWSF